MILQLQPNQISGYWDQIKPGAISAMGLDPLDARTSEYTNNLFMSLLNGTHQVWLIMDDERDVYALGITCIVEDKLTGKCSLHIDAFYSFKTLPESLAVSCIEPIKAYAKSCGCEQLRAYTNQPRAMRLLQLVGFWEGKTEYLLHCG